MGVLSRAVQNSCISQSLVSRDENKPSAKRLAIRPKLMMSRTSLNTRDNMFQGFSLGLGHICHGGGGVSKIYGH